ncbi:MAG: caspase family protein [Caldilineaceae bacterium]
MNVSPNFYALLIGIDKYDARSRVPHLRGCVTDVDQMETVLRERLGVPQSHILCLTDEQATHQAIKDAFRHHLIGNARQWAEHGAAGAPPIFLMHYSGHGSQALDETGAEPDGLDETLVPYDSRTPGIFDIKDWELGALIEELNRYSDNVTIVLDCCHSGSGTRDPQLPLTRRCAPDLRPQPQASQRPAGRITRNLTAGNWDISGQHVLLAGCRDREESNEYGVLRGGRRYWQGAMSYFLQQELQQLPPDRTTTYRELFERVRHAVNKTYSNQMPQCEGDIDRELFGGLRPTRDPFFTVVDRRDGLFWLDGGMIHGITAGSELKAFPADLRAMAEAGAPLATLRVVEEGAVESGCEPIEANATVPLHARCTIHRLNQGNMQRTVALAIGDPTLAEHVRQRLRPTEATAQIDVSPWLAVVELEAGADFRVALVDGQLEIQDDSGKLLVAPFLPNDLVGLATDLAHLARYQNALTLRNRAPSKLTGAISLAVKRLALIRPRKRQLQRNLNGSLGALVIETGTRVVLEVTNHSDQPLYFAIFDFSPDWAVNLIYPTIKGAHEALKPGGVFSHGLTNRRRGQLMATLPDGMVDAIERFKVIATVHETNFELLQQGALKSPFVSRDLVGVFDANSGESATAFCFGYPTGPGYQRQSTVLSRAAGFSGR